MDQIADQSNGKPLNQWNTSRTRAFSTDEALRLRLRGYDAKDIAAKYGVTRSAVTTRLRNLDGLFDSDALKQYKDKRADILNHMERIILSEMLDPDRLVKASLNNLAYAYTAINNSRRLEEGVATSIVDTGVNNMRLIDIINRRAILMSQLKSISVPSTVDTEQPQGIIDITPGIE